MATSPMPIPEVERLNQFPRKRMDMIQSCSGNADAVLQVGSWNQPTIWKQAFRWFVACLHCVSYRGRLQSSK